MIVDQRPRAVCMSMSSTSSRLASILAHFNKGILSIHISYPTPSESLYRYDEQRNREREEIQDCRRTRPWPRCNASIACEKATRRTYACIQSTITFHLLIIVYSSLYGQRIGHATVVGC